MTHFRKAWSGLGTRGWGLGERQLRGSRTPSPESPAPNPPVSGANSVLVAVRICTLIGNSAVCAMLLAICFSGAFCWERGECAEPGDAEPAAEPVDPNAIVVDKEARTVSIPARVAPQGTQSDLKGMVEYLLVSRGGKAYETVFVTYRQPAEIRQALESVGLHAGQPAHGETMPCGSPVSILAEYESEGKKIRRPVDEFVAYAREEKEERRMGPQPWVYTGSVNVTDPSTGKPILQASLTGSVIGLHTVDGSPLFQNPRHEGFRDNIYKASAELLPPAGTRVRLVFTRVVRQTPEGTRRIYVLISGRVRGMGFREFAQRQAMIRGLKGFVRGLGDDRIEVVAEGPAVGVDELLEKLKRGPHAAKVENVDITEESPEQIFKEFEIWL